ATWHISDATTFLADGNYDTDSGRLGTGSVGLAVARTPRLGYYAGLRCIGELDSSVGTLGLRYRINRKYTVNVFEQYDLDFRGGQNEVTVATLVRKFSRLHTAFTFAYDRAMDEVTVVFSIWPAGIPEIRLGGGRLAGYTSTFNYQE
ncbi:hypothetical protein LCGC14_1559310, partial [marine sediment metagenome]